MSTNTSKIAFTKTDDGNQNWGTEVRNNFDILEAVLVPENCFYVSPGFTDANVEKNGAPTDKRHFDNIQEAITAWESGDFDENSHGRIFVFPGRYAERLAITKSVCLEAVSGGHVLHDGRSNGSSGVNLRGDTSALPLIDIDIEASGTGTVVIKGFSFTHTATETGSEITNAMVCIARDQGSGNYGTYTNNVIFEDCTGRLDNTNVNSWHTAFRAENWNRMVFNRCSFSFPSTYANDYVRFPFYADSDSASYPARIVVNDCRVRHDEFGSAVSNWTIYIVNNSSGKVHRSTFNRDYVSGEGLTGVGATSSIDGIQYQAHADAYGNLVGIVTTEW